jgi:hypothetical protein
LQLLERRKRGRGSRAIGTDSWGDRQGGVNFHNKLKDKINNLVYLIRSLFGFDDERTFKD